MRLFPVCALTLLLATMATAAHAGPEALPTADLNTEARTQYKAGTDALTAGRYVEAALHFETATSRTPHAVSWYMAAEAWEHASRPERAADALSRALDVPGMSAELGERVRARLKALEASLCTVVLGGQSSYRASIDGSTPIAPPARVHGLPGVHVVTIIPPDRAASRREVALAAGAEVTISLGDDEDDAKTVRVEPKAETRIVEREVPRPAETRKYVGFGVLGLGLASLGAAAILGANALDAKDAYASSRTADAYDHVRTVQAWSNVALVTGLLLTAGGVALVMWPDGDAKKADLDKAARRRDDGNQRRSYFPGLASRTTVTFGLGGAALQGAF